MWKENAVTPNTNIAEEEKPFDLPEKWEWTTFDNISKINGGFAFKSSEYVDKGVRVVRISDFDEGGFKDDKIVRYRFSTALEDFLLSENNILLAMTGGTVGKSLLVKTLPEKMLVNQRVATIKLYNGVEPLYVNSLIRTNLIQDVIQNAKNSTNDNISMNDIKSFRVPFPPLAEQEQIVAKVDSLMSLCDEIEKQQQKKVRRKRSLNKASLFALNASENKQEFNKNWNHITKNFDLLYSTPENVNDLKQTILQLAVQGKLTEKWRKGNPNAEPASVLLEKTAKEKERLIKEGEIKKQKPLPEITEEEKPFELPEGWEWCRLGDTLEPTFPLSYGVLVPGQDNKDGIPFIRVKDLDTAPSGVLPEKRISKAIDRQYQRTRLVGGEILICVVGSIGKVAIAHDNWIGANIARAVCRYMPNKLLNKEFLFTSLRSPFVQNYFQEGWGSINPTLNIKVLEKTLIPLPPIKEQIQIVNAVNLRAGLCDTLSKQLQEYDSVTANLLSATIQESE